MSNDILAKYEIDVTKPLGQVLKDAVDFYVKNATPLEKTPTQVIRETGIRQELTSKHEHKLDEITTRLHKFLMSELMTDDEEWPMFYQAVISLGKRVKEDRDNYVSERAGARPVTKLTVPAADLKAIKEAIHTMYGATVLMRMVPDGLPYKKDAPTELDLPRAPSPEGRDYSEHKARIASLQWTVDGRVHRNLTPRTVAAQLLSTDLHPVQAADLWTAFDRESIMDGKEHKAVINGKTVIVQKVN